MVEEQVQYGQVWASKISKIEMGSPVTFGTNLPSVGLPRKAVLNVNSLGFG